MSDLGDIGVFEKKHSWRTNAAGFGARSPKEVGVSITPDFVTRYKYPLNP